MQRRLQAVGEEVEEVHRPAGGRTVAMEGVPVLATQREGSHSLPASTPAAAK